MNDQVVRSGGGTILVLNAGSSSLKFSVFRSGAAPDRSGLLCEGQCENIGHRGHFIAKNENAEVLADEQLKDNTTHADALQVLLGSLETNFPHDVMVVAGHRVVHGGARYSSAVRIDDSVIAELRRLIPLAPLHQPHHIEAIEALSKLHPDLPQVACFDTAFHHTESSVATSFAIPRHLSGQGIRRYGFHGLSYEYIAGALPDVAGSAVAEGRVVVAHLGSGASLCAMHAGRSVATTMSFTALDGLMMARRCGSLDPGVILYLMQEKGMTADQVSHLLYNDCGLAGVSGISDDMRVLLASDAAPAQEAVALFVYRITRELGSMAAALGGIDALVFTAGIGEHASPVRRMVCEQAAWLGLAFDPAANQNGGPRISRDDSPMSAWVIPTDEDLVIARHAWDVLRAGHPC